jgi:hypothetical protein
VLPIYQAHEAHHVELQVQGVRQGFNSCLEKGWVFYFKQMGVENAEETQNNNKNKKHITIKK